MTQRDVMGREKKRKEKKKGNRWIKPDNENMWLERWMANLMCQLDGPQDAQIYGQTLF